MGMGGGGGNSGQYYENQNRLLGVQADIAQGVYNSVYQPFAPGAVADLNAMRTEAMDGSLAERARATAGADAGAALGQGLEATNRNLARYGLNPHRFAADSSAIALGGAALKADAMNKAEQWAEGQKWGRSFDFYNALSGIPTQTANALGSAASGYGSMAGSIGANNSNAAAGFGAMGMYAGRNLFARTGGYIKDGEVHLAAGGMAPALPKINIGSMGGGAPRGLSAGDAAMSFAAPMAMSAATNYVGKNVVKPWLREVGTGIRDVAGAMTTDTAFTPIAAEKAAEAAGASANFGGDAWAASKLAEDAAFAESATLSGATSGLGSTLGAAAPWLAGGLVLANILGEFASGGEVRGLRRKDMRAGGRVAGPGTATSDSIPARLSDGEYVLNAEAVRMVGKETLDEVNRRGLEQRGDVALADGGFLDRMKRAVGLESEAERDARWREENEERLRRYEARQGAPVPTSEAKKTGIDPSVGGAVGAIRNYHKEIDKYAKGGLVKKRRC